MSRIAILSDIHFGEFCRASSFYMPGEEVQVGTDTEAQAETYHRPFRCIIGCSGWRWGGLLPTGFYSIRLRYV